MAITPISDDAFVMTAICGSTKNTFGITVDRLMKNHYKFVWAFKVDEKLARREKYDTKKRIEYLEFDRNYPGCPHCKAKQVVFCSCGAVVCWEGGNTMSCPKCGYSGPVGYGGAVDIKGGVM